MGTGNSNYGKYIGMLAAVIFIAVAFVMLLVKDDVDGVLTQTSQIILTVAGVFTLIAGILLTTRKIQMSLKYDGILIFLLGIVAALTYVFVKFAEMDSALVVEIIGIVGAIAILVGCFMDMAKKHKVMMYVGAIFFIIEAIIVILLFMGSSLSVKEASAVIVIGLWLATYLVMGTDDVVEEEAAIDPSRKSAKKAQKQKSKADAEARKKQERQEKLEAKNRAEAKAKHKKAEAKKEEAKKEEAKKEEAKPEQKKEQPKKEEPAKKVEPVSVKEEPKKAAEPVKEEPKPEPVPVPTPVVAEKPAEPVKEAPKAEPAPVKEEPKKPNNDFMSRLVSSKDVGGKIVPPTKVEPVKEEPAPVKEEAKAEPEPVKEEPEPEPAKEEPRPEPEPVLEPEPIEEPAVEETPVEPEPAEESVFEEEAVVPEVEEVPAEPVVAAAAAAVVEEAATTSAPGDEAESEEEEVLEDIYTDYSPEALVRRAAWNKGMRCRRDYGDYHIPVAFVKGKVAVYVEEPGTEDKEVEAKLKEEGWVVLRYDINKVTDGLAEGAEIADAVKANVRAQKAAKKKKASKK